MSEKDKWVCTIGVSVRRMEISNPEWYVADLLCEKGGTQIEAGKLEVYQN